MYLNCHTYYSMRYGTFSMPALCKLAKTNGISKVALTDINNTSGCLPFLKIAHEFDIQPAVGIDFRNGAEQQYVGIAKNNNGFRQLNEFLSARLHAKSKFEPQSPFLNDCYFIYPFEKIIQMGKIDFSENEFIGISIESLRKLKLSPYRSFHEKLVLLQTLSFRGKKDFNAHRLLRCIDNNTLLSKLPISEQGSPNHHPISASLLENEFLEFPHILKNTERLMRNCSVNFNFGKNRTNQNLQVAGKNKEEDVETLKTLCFKNLSKRYLNASEEIQKRVERELESIIGLGFVSYFLINLDIVRYAKSRNFPFIGRGSGANSIVAYIIGITNVDPIELDLYFERFINPERNSPPDFDIDFSWKDRDEITAYIFKKYEHTALIAAYVTFQKRAVIRELGKVFGLPKAEIDKLSSGYFRKEKIDEMGKLVLKYSYLIEGLPNYLSVHSSGIMIANTSVYDFAGTFLPPKGFPTIQIDMHAAEDVGIFKFDILSQRGLSKITDAIEIIKKNQPEAKIADIDDVAKFKTDPKINDLLKAGDCMGVFYVESPAMKGLLTKLQTDNYLGLVAASSIIRPGVSSSGMKDEYIKRHRFKKSKPEEFPQNYKGIHPVLYEIMPETYGIMVYQEDVLKVAHFFGGLTLGEADLLRRGMSGKKLPQGAMETIEKKFWENCLKKGHSEKLIEEIWYQISSFAGYAFPKGHSASYAVESYQSLYLKCYFPLEFMVAVLNNGGGFYRPETYIRELKRCGGKVRPPCINKSDHPTVIEGKEVFLGFGYLKELESKTIRRILENRQFFGAFKSLDDFIDRVPISLEQLTILLRIGAFRFTGLDKHHLLWKATFKLGNSKPKSDQALLFQAQHKDFVLPKFDFSLLTEIYDQFDLLGFSLHSHFKLLKNPLKPALSATDFSDYIGKNIQVYGELITLRKTRTSQNQYMYFGNFYDVNGNFFNTVHFPMVAKKYPIHAKGVFLCYGKLVNEFGHFSLIIDKIMREEISGDPRLEMVYK